MVRKDVHWGHSALEVVAPVATGHDDGKHLLIS